MGEELLEGLPAPREPLHHHPTRVQAGPAGRVVLARRDDRHAGALDRGRRVGHDDVVAVVGQLDVVPTVGDDHMPVGVGQDRRRVVVVDPEHRRHRRDELDRLRLQSGDERAAVGRAHPERDGGGRLRRRAGDQRQDRHQLRVDGQERHRGTRHPEVLGAVPVEPRPGPTRSRPRRSGGPFRPSARSGRPTGRRSTRRRRRPRRPGRRARHPRSAIARRTPGAASPPPSARRIARPALTIAIRARAEADPMTGITTNGMRNVPAIAPSGVDRQDQAGTAADLAVPTGDQRGRGREAQAHHERRGQHDQGARPAGSRRTARQAAR